MIKKFTQTMTICTFVFICSLTTYASDETAKRNTEKQIQMSTSIPSQNFNNIQSDKTFQNQLNQMHQMQNYMNENIKHTLSDPFFSQGALNNQNISIPQFARVNYPQIKYFEKNNEYTTQLIVPGMNKKNIKIELKNNILTVSGNAKKQEQTTKENHVSNYSYTNNFSQSIRIPHDVDVTKISSNYKDGVLTITLPKSKVKETTSQIIPID